MKKWVTARCSACNSTDVYYDAWSGVNDPLDVITFDKIFCSECDGETTLIFEEKPTRINGAEVFDSEGTLALTINGIDAIHMTLLRGVDNEAYLNDAEYQQVIDAVLAILGISPDKPDNSELNDQEFACLILRECGAARYIVSALGSSHAAQCGFCKAEQEGE